MYLRDMTYVSFFTHRNIIITENFFATKNYDFNLSVPYCRGDRKKKRHSKPRVSSTGHTCPV